MKNIIQIEKLLKSFGSNKVLQGVDLEVKEGENLAVLGKSGSGKSVLIKCIIGLLLPDAGTIKVFDKSITEFTEEELNEMRSKVGFLFQSNALYDSMSVRENLEFPLRRHLQSMDKNNVEERVVEALNNVGLTETMDKMPSELSGGMRKRIALARTLILQPKIILYDEPTSGLDPITSKEISRLILNIQEKYNTSSIIISHDVNCVKITANRIVLLIDGINYATGSYDQFHRSEDPQIKPYFD